MSEESAVPTEDDLMDMSVPEEVVLDENVLAEGHAGFSLGGFEVLHIRALNRHLAKHKGPVMIICIKIVA